MNRIKRILQSLSKTEIRFLKSYLTVFHQKGPNKALETIRLLEKDLRLTQSELAQKLYGDPKSKAFIMLKSRLFEKMLESMSLSAHFQSNPLIREDLPAYESIEIQKQLTYATLLRHRGLEELAREVLIKCARQAKETGLPEYRLLALIYLRNLSISPEELVWHLAQEIDQSFNQFQTDLIGISIFDEFRVLSKTPTGFDQKKTDWLADKIFLLEKRLENTYSIRAHYCYLTLLISLHEGRRNYQSGKERLRELIGLIENHKGLQSKNRLGTPSLRLASIEMKEGNFQAALYAATEAMDAYSERRFNYFSAAIYKIFACIFSGQLTEARKTMSDIAWFRNQKRRNMSLEVAQYLESCIAYFSGSPREALNILGNVNEIFSDKCGWNMGLRIHEVLLLVDLREYDLASARIATLRKHVARYEVNDRISAIFKYLYALDRFAFDFLACSKAMNPLLNQLTNTLPWTAVHYEVIRFDSWVRAHLKSINPYTCMLSELNLIKIT